MKIYYKKVTGWIIAGIITVLGSLTQAVPIALAVGNGLTVSPMIQKIIINPGETHQASFEISNPSNSTEDLYYELSVEPFYADEQNSITYQAQGNMSDIVNWVEFDVPTEGKIEPNGTKEVIFTINVPKTAPAGGQYLSIMAIRKNNPNINSDSSDSSDNTRQTMIEETYRMAHPVYAEVTGNTVRQGEISNINLPGFIFSGKITGTSSAKNLGNVHGDARYTLQVFPIFSGEEIYTNEENPETHTILPDRTYYNETSWDNTPAFGIFNVIYTVEFAGVTEQVSKMVIVCPLWLLFIIIFVIAAIIIYFVMRSKSRKK